MYYQLVRYQRSVDPIVARNAYTHARTVPVHPFWLCCADSWIARCSRNHMSACIISDALAPSGLDPSLTLLHTYITFILPHQTALLFSRPLFQRGSLVAVVCLFRHEMERARNQFYISTPSYIIHKAYHVSLSFHRDRS